MESAKRLMASENVPICILNGALGGTRIDQHQRTPDNPADLTTLYGKWLWRLKQARRTHGIRGVLWHQGENDQPADTPSGDPGWVGGRVDQEPRAAQPATKVPRVPGRRSLDGGPSMSQNPVGRRVFLQECAISLATLASARRCAGAGVVAGTGAAGKRLGASDVVTLGRSGVLASRQGVGLGDGTLDAYRRMGPADFTKFIRHALDQGVRSFDLLPGPAHTMLARALKGVPRESYTLVTNFRHPTETNPARMIEAYLRELETDYLDAILVGAILTRDWAGESKWAERRDLLSAAKQRGQVRGHGVSVHGWEALQSIATDPWVELALVSCNHLGTWMDGPPGRTATDLERRDLSLPLLRDIHRAGIGTAAMKVFSHSGYRDAANPAEERFKAVRFVLSTGAIDTLPILCGSVAEFDEVTRLIHRAGDDPGQVG